MSAVVAQHCGLLPFGWMGVWLFFVISGFVVTLALTAGRPVADGRRGLGSFFRRRTARIAPIYFGYVLVGAAFAAATARALDPLALASLLGFFNNAAMIVGRGELAGWSVGHLWTISTEMQFYLLYGLAMFLAERRLVVLLLAASIVAAPALRLAASAALAAHGWDSEASAYAIYAGPFLHVDAFAAGALLAFAARAGLLDGLARPLAAAGLAALCAYAAGYVAVNYALRDARGVEMLRCVVSGVLWGEGRQVVLYSAVNAASVGLVALAASDDALVRRLLGLRILQRIGETSYGAYVYHGIGIWAAASLVALVPGADHAGEIGRSLLVFATAYAMTVTAAEISYRHIELRFIRGRPPRRSGGAAAEAAS